MYNLEFDFETHSFCLSPLELTCVEEKEKKQKEDVVVDHENQTYIKFD